MLHRASWLVCALNTRHFTEDNAIEAVGKLKLLETLSSVLHVFMQHPRVVQSISQVLFQVVTLQRETRLHNPELHVLMLTCIPSELCQ